MHVGHARLQDSAQHRDGGGKHAAGTGHPLHPVGGHAEVTDGHERPVGGEREALALVRPEPGWKPGGAGRETAKSLR